MTIYKIWYITKSNIVDYIFLTVLAKFMQMFVNLDLACKTIEHSQ